MKTYLKTLSLTLAALVALVLARHVGAATPSGAESVDLAWKHAVEAGDLDAVVACYGEHAMLWLPGDAGVQGRAAIRETYRALLAANTVSRVTYTGTRYRGNGALQGGAGSFSLTLTPKSGGAPVQLSGRFSTLVEKEGGAWVYTVDHASADPGK